MSGVKLQIEISDKVMERMILHEEIMKGKATHSTMVNPKCAQTPGNIAPSNPEFDSTYLQMLAKMAVPILTGEPDLATWLRKMAVDYMMSSSGTPKPVGPPSTDPHMEEVRKRMGLTECSEEERKKAKCSGATGQTKPQVQPPYPEEEDIVGTSVYVDEEAVLIMESVFKSALHIDSDVVSNWLSRLVCGKLDDVPKNIQVYFSNMLDTGVVLEPSEELQREIDEWVVVVQNDENTPQEVRDFLGDRGIIFPSMRTKGSTVSSMNDVNNCEEPKCDWDVSRSTDIPISPPLPPRAEDSYQSESNDTIRMFGDMLAGILNGASTGDMKGEECLAEMAKMVGFDTLAVQPSKSEVVQDSPVRSMNNPTEVDNQECSESNDNSIDSTVIIEDCPSDE